MTAEAKGIPSIDNNEGQNNNGNNWLQDFQKFLEMMQKDPVWTKQKISEAFEKNRWMAKDLMEGLNKMGIAVDASITPQIRENMKQMSKDPNVQAQMKAMVELMITIVSAREIAQQRTSIANGTIGPNYRLQAIARSIDGDVKEEIVIISNKDNTMLSVAGQNRPLTITPDEKGGTFVTNETLQKELTLLSTGKVQAIRTNITMEDWLNGK